MVDEDEDFEYYDDDDLVDENPCENTALVDDVDISDLGEVSKPRANFIERDRLKFTPNIGVLRIKPRLTKDPIDKKKTKWWINDFVKSVELIKVSDIIDDKSALCTLGQALCEIDPKKYDPDIYDFANIERDAKEAEIDKDIPQTIEQLFLKYQILGENYVNTFGASIIVPPVIYMANSYKEPMTKVYPEFEELIGKTVPMSVVKLVTSTPDGKDMFVYRFSTDTVFEKVKAKLNDNTETFFLAPTKCEGVIDLVSYSSYKYLKEITQNV